MEELNSELLGRLHGYWEWAAEVSWHKQRHDTAKKEFLQQLEKHKKSGFEKNAALIKTVSALITQKQIPFHTQNIHVHEDIRETMNALKVLFQDMHAELFVEDAVYAAEKMHQHAIELHDAISKQGALFKGISQETFEDFMPQILYLYEKEAQSHDKIKQYAQEASQSTHIILKHMNDNYFITMKKLAQDPQYIEDHRPLFVATYALGLCSRTLGAIYGVPSEEIKEAEALFVNNVVRKQ